MSTEPLWRPSESQIRRTQMSEFMQRVAQRHGTLPDWEAVRRWSIEQNDRFWEEMLDIAGVKPATPATAIRSGAGMLDTRWFAGMTLNYARHMLRFDGDEPALLFENESLRGGSLSRRMLREEVARCAVALRNTGVKRGDRVGGFLPNIPETIIAMLATASLGAIWSSCSPDFGVGGVLDRFGQIEPTVLIATDGYSYNGKRVSTLERVVEMLPRLTSAQRVVIVPFLDDTHAAKNRVSAALGERGVLWRDFLGSISTAAPPLTFEEVPFDHPLFIMYSSGTTGVPKCIVHGHGGTLLQHAKEHMLHCDIRAGERVFYFTTCGWMMWNWLVSALGVGATVVLYEGNPGYPDLSRLWEMAARLKVAVFGTSPKFIAACQKAGISPGREHDLAALRCVLSTGSPLSAEQFHWIYEHIKRDLQLSSISGGTDIISCFMLGNPILPVYAGEIQCRGLAMDVRAWDDSGHDLVGEKGELVCATPFPSQPVGFWNDPDGKKYRAAYFERFTNPPVWRHGDFIEITPNGGIIVYGRSDATLNPGGVRIGTAEIYRIVESISEIVDSLVVDRETADNDVEICLFVVLRQGLKLDGALETRIREAIASGATRRHVPRHIRQVTEIPHTISGKKVELAVRQMLHGQAVKNRDALANPHALDQFSGII